MADKKLNAEYGYGQLELNQCAFRRDGRIEAQCKIADGIEYLENGMILAINDANRTVVFFCPFLLDLFSAVSVVFWWEQQGS